VITSALRAGLLPVDNPTRGHWEQRFTLINRIPYRVRVRDKAMPPIPKEYLNCSIYLYPSEQAARSGERFGGSGFLISVPVEGHPAWGSLYAVTNKHVLDEGCRFIRLNTLAGGIDVLETERDAWFDYRDRYDVSVYSLDLEGKPFNHAAYSTELLITREIITDYRISPGDEAFLIGRLITPWGQQRNNPAVRFGNISMMADPTEPARGHDGIEQEAFYVECRSLSGFSGSPVFVTTTQVYRKEDEHVPRQIRNPVQGQPVKEGEKAGLKAEFVAVSGTFGPWLLGIDWGHLPLWKPVFEQDKVTRTDYQVEQNTGIACVLPAWHILDLLNEEEELVKERKRDKEELDQRKRESAVLDVEKPEPLTKAGFEEALQRASQKISQPESESDET
jgi:hypothetical protein